MSLSPAVIDYHIHTVFSEDSRALPGDCARRAAERGLSGIIFTEHLEFPPPPGDDEGNYCPQRVLPFASYRGAVDELRAAWEGKLSIGIGAELGLEPHNLTAYGPYCREFDPRFDFVLGSLHSIQGFLVQSADYTDRLGPAGGAGLYFERLLLGVERAAETGACDAIGHLDLVKRSPSFGEFRLVDHRGYLEELLRVIIDGGLGIEVNTSGYRQSPGEPYPGTETLRLYREMGGEILTVGSDSHTASTVGQESVRVLDFIRSTGFRHITRFSGRKPEFIDI